VNSCLTDVASCYVLIMTYLSFLNSPNQLYSSLKSCQQQVEKQTESSCELAAKLS